MPSQPDDTEAGGVDRDLKLLLLQHDLDESRHTNLRLRQSLLAPPYAQLRFLLRRHPGAAAPIVKALNVVSGTGTVNVHRKLLARLQLPRDLRDVRNSGFFDAGWYETVYPEVPRSGMDPLHHFVRIGAAHGFDPGPRFSTGFYVDHAPDAAGRDTNALLHYVRFGRARGNQIAPSTMDRQWLAVTMDERFPNLRPLRVYETTGPAPRISMVTDSISSGSLFGGVGTALIFSTLLAARMGRPLRVITRAEPPNSEQLPSGPRRQPHRVERQRGLCLLSPRRRQRPLDRRDRRGSVRHDVLVDDLGDTCRAQSRGHHLHRSGG